MGMETSFPNPRLCTPTTRDILTVATKFRASVPVPYSVILALDEATSAVVENMWTTLASRGIASEGAVQGNHPHITLGVYHDEAKREIAAEVIRNFAGRREPIPFALSGYGIFPGAKCALWVVPTVTQALFAMHRELHRAVNSDDLRYAPDHWMPHITLARELEADDAVAGLRAIIPIWQELKGSLLRIELIRFVPVIVLEAYSFSRDA
jgi:2'-5' RNA ligase